MKDISPLPSPIRFAIFEVDAQAAELRRQGVKIKLQEQPFQVLMMLLERPGQVVTREDLQKKLWPVDTFVDFERGLNRAINKLREALGDDADSPRFIETLPRRGYRFVAPVEAAGPRENETAARNRLILVSQALPQKEERRHPRLGWTWLWVTGAAALLVALGLSLTSWRKTPVSPNFQFTVSPPAGFFLEGGSNAQSFSVSDDARKLAFLAMDSTGKFRAFTRDLDSVGIREVPNSVGAGGVSWLSDGSLSFVAGRDLRRISAGQESSQLLATGIVWPFTAFLLPSNRLFIGQRLNPAVVPVAGGTPQPAKQRYDWAQLLPDGRILYVVADPKTGLYRGQAAVLDKPDTVVSLGLEAESRLVYAGSREPGKGYLLYLRGGALMANRFDARSLQLTGTPAMLVRGIDSFRIVGSGDFAASARGEVLVYRSTAERTQFIWADRQGKRLSTVGPERMTSKYVRLSPDGRKFAWNRYNYEEGGTQIWVTDLANNVSRQRTRDPWHSHGAAWSPDGKKIAFVRGTADWPKMYVLSLDGEGNEERMPDGDWQFPTDWSRDGRYIVYSTRGKPLVENEDHSDIFVIDLKGKPIARPLIQTRFHEASPAFSPDGKWLAFLSNETGQPEIYLQQLEHAEPLRMVGERFIVPSRRGVVCLRWRADGEELFHLGADGTLYASQVKLGTAPALQPPEALFRIDTDAIAAVHSLIGFDVSADGTRFLIPAIAGGEPPPLTVVTNWETLIH